jgi:hypothetical protein
MVVVSVTGLVSVVLFGLATWFMARAAAKPPLAIRTESRRSPAEYAFNHQCSMARRLGRMCLLAGTMSLGVCAMIGMLAALHRAD